MGDNTFLLLGLLKGQKQHGYQLNEFIDRNLSRFITMKKATAYSVLDRMLAKGLIAEEQTQVGNRPPRKVYTITPAGEAHFALLLRESLGRPRESEFYGDLGLIFLNQIAPEQALELLQDRQKVLSANCAALKRIPLHDGHLGQGLFGVDLAVSRQTALMEADLAWLTHTIEELRRKP